MAAFCVDTHSKLFKDIAKRLDISEDTLELIAYKYGNQEGTFGKFPSDEYILDSIQGKQDISASEAQIRLWELRYSQPRVFETIEEANQFIQDTQEYFDNDSIVLTTTNDGKFRVSVAEPFNQEAYQKEIASIKEKAIADGTFMKVRNKQGELVDSNLNEQQWLQVRTKAFKRWFGDWENDPANASKVVDENGEPLVVYHTSDGSRDSRFNTFDTNIEGRKSAIYHTDSEYMSLSYLLKDTDDLDDFGSNRAIQYLDSIINDIQTVGHIEEFYDFITGKQQTAFDIINNIVSPFNITIEKKSTYTIDEIRALQDKLSKLGAKSESESIVKADFVNIKNPLIVNGNGRNWNDLEFNGNIESTRSIEDYYRDSEYDGIIFRSIVDYGGGAQFSALANKEQAPHNVYAAYNPNQIKSATENRGSFSESGNIYKSEGERLVPNKFILFGYEEYKFNEYLKKSRGELPKEFTTSFHGERVTLRKSLKNKNSRKYDIIGEDGRVIAEKLPLYTEAEYKNLQKRIAESISKFKPYKEGASIRFKAFLQKPSKGLFKYTAKTWLTEALNTGSLKVNYKDIDEFVDKFSDSFWENVVTYVLNPQYGRNGTVFGEMTTKNPWSEGWIFNETIPKQGLIEKLEELYGIKIDGSKLWGESIDRTQRYGELEKLLVDYIESRSKYKFTEEERIATYARVNGIPIEDVKREVERLRSIASTEGDSNASKELHKIIDYSPVESAIEKIKSEYRAKYLQYLKDKGIIIPTDVANIIFNREIFSGEDTRVNRLATIFHEPFHALEVLVGNTEKMNGIYNAYKRFVNTTYGKELLEGVEDFNTVYQDGDIRSEVLANIFSLIMMPAEYRAAFLNQNSENKILGVFLGNKINELLSRPSTEKFLEAKTTTEEQEILKTVTVEEKEALPVLKRLWNEFVGLLEKFFKFSGESIKFAEKINYIDKTISETVVTEKTSYEEIEKLNESLAEFRDALGELTELLQDITGIEVTEDTKLRQSQTAKNAQQQSYINHSGGAVGSDSYWGSVGEKYGVKSNHYYHGAKTPVGNVAITEEQFNEGKQKVLQTNRTLNRRPDRYMDLLARNWMQVKNSDSIFAIGHLKNGIVDGGTGWAVQMAIDAGKPVYVFDQERGEWFKNIGGQWSRSDVPTLTPNFAGIGTKQLNDTGKRAIEAVYEKTFSQQQAPQQQVQPTQTQSTEQEPMWAPPKVEREFHTKEVDLVTKIDNLYSGDIDASEISSEADKAVDWISDQLTQYMENHELVYKKFFEDSPSSPSKEEVMKKLNSISSRKEMLELIGMDKMLEFYKEEVLSMTDENADIFDNMSDAELDKYDAIKENLDGLIQLGYARFLSREGFGFGISDIEGEKFTVIESSNPEEQVNPDDFNGQADIDGNEEVRNQQDHWQIENATRDIMDNASAKVKQAIADCYVLEDNGKVDERGNKQYDNAKDSLNRNERVVPIKAVRSIVKWVQGATTLSQMTAKLAAKQATNPWISQIVTRLQDTTGNESDFQSQFFNTFCKFFQPYSIVKRRADGTFYTMVVNAHPALNDAMNAIGIQYKTGAFPLVNEEGIVQMSNVEELSYIRDTLQSMGPVNEENRAQVVELIGNVLYAIGAPQPSDAINRILTNTLKDLVWANTKNIVEKLTAAADKKGYNPLQFTDNPNGIRNYIKNIISPFTEQLEDTLVSAVYDGGKMYQSNITPSWTTKLFTKMHLPDKEFRQFIIKDFGQSEWFIEDPSVLSTMSEEEQLNYISDHPEIWRLPWIGEIVSMSESERQKAFQHKVQLNFNKQNYMRGMNDLEYVMSVFTEYFSDSSQNETGELFGYYRFPMISNKPSNEFIRFKRHTDVSEFGDGRREILDGFVKIFHQELSRIQTVEMRNLKKGDAGFIANFDADGGKGRGLQFNFLDYLNEYLNGNKKDTALGKLIDRKLHGTETTKLTSEELTELDNLVRTEIANHLDALAERLIDTYKQNGLFESLKNIEHIGKSDAAVEEAISEFAWNDNYANANILEFLVTDKAYYKNEEDLQKRLAQVHSPGTRGNWEATDFEGKPISDGKVRVLKLADYAKVISSTIDNVAEVFDRKIAEADESDKQAWIDLKESVLEAYRDINVVDGQAFVSPTAYRKKAIAFGEWTKEDEEVYNELKKGKANLAQTKKVFNPRKPFTYGKVNKKVNAGLGTPIKTLNYGVQYKNSEYLLIMADALLRGQNTSRPNLLGALFDLMEQSAETNPTRGIDFVVFESGVKTGLTGPVSINEFIEDPNGKEKAFTKLWNSAFNEDGTYNEDFIDVLDAEDYTTQQTVPEHFMHGDLQWGSQVRVIVPSDLESFYNGQDVYYEYVDPQTGKVVPMQADEIRAEWEKNTAAMIQKGIDTLSKELGLSRNNLADRNVLISKLLQREIWSNPRYGVDLLLACSVDENGNFRIPLGDPIQSKRIEQLLNSIVKNRINKQKVAGGTLVEVTNFGTSKRLEIRYKDKNGNLLTSKRDYLAQGHTEEEFKRYLENNQNGIAYYECYAPAWTRYVFQKFTDENGTVDVEAIEMLDPDLLKMFGYRIPTEDKYSTAPYKIVGFLPQEAGDGFMQPWETTVIDGSDFDVDKKNLMRMALKIKSALLSKKEFFEKEGITEDNDENTKKYKEYKRRAVSARTIFDKLADSGNISLSEEERKEAEWYEKSRYRRDRKALKEERDLRNEQAEDFFEKRYKELGLDKLNADIQELENRDDLTATDEKRLAEYKEDYEKKYDKLSKYVDGMRAANEKWYKKAAERRRQKLSENIKYAIEATKKRKKGEVVRRILRDGVFRDSSTIPANQRAVFLAVKEAYIKTAFKAEKPEVGSKGDLNNRMFNMQWAIATHASTTDKMLNPGNFDPQKRMGYMVAANRLGYAWSELEKMSTDDIKDLVFTSKNLMDFDVQTQFYKQNSVAGQILGIFAVAKSAHAMFEGRRYGIIIDSPFSIDGMSFGGVMEYDVKYDRNGVTLVGKHLGSLVGASADAVKDPVLNFMNINKETINVLNTALRFGLDFDTASLLLSSNVIGNILDIYRRNSLSQKTSFDKEIKNAIRKLEELEYIGKDSSLKSQDLTKKEMIWAITAKVRENDIRAVQRANQINYKILNAVYQLSKISQRAQPLTDLSRLNSVTSAPGPLHINTIASDRKLGPDVSMDGIVKLKDGYKDSEGHIINVGTSYVGDTLVTESNLNKMNLSGDIQYFLDYDTVNRDTVFDEIPSLRAFYESYNIVKRLFKDLGFTTASDSFIEDVLAAVPDDLRFSLYNKEKLLSSLADFFQSYILVQSDVIKASELKNYTQNFVKEYIQADYKSKDKYKNNPLIQAIQPTLISKEGEPDRYALKIDTTGMEQSEKDALSAGWIQLEKVDSELSHKLFAYNFFRGGIGFNPKTFMSLVPIQVKEGIQGYIEAYSKIPRVDGATVIDQWIRNNWGNSDLVTPISGIKADASTKYITLYGKKRSEAYGSPYIKVTTKDGDFLFKETARKDKKSTTYEQIQPLGNNGEYLEMYPSEVNTTPLDSPQRATLALEESDHLEEKIDNPETDVQTPEEQTRELVDFYQTTYGEEGRQEREKQDVEKAFDEANKDLDITTNKDKFDKTLEDFC